MTWCFSAGAGSKTGCWVNWPHAFNAKEGISFYCGTVVYCKSDIFEHIQIYLNLNLLYKPLRSLVPCLKHNKKKKSRKATTGILNIQLITFLVSCPSSCHPNPCGPPQQLAWIAPPHNCYHLLGVNIFRVRRCGIKFSSTCRGKGKRSTSAAPSPRSWCRANEGETLKNRGPGARMCSATPAAVPPTPQLLLRHLASSLSVLSRCQTDTQSVQQFISYHRVSYEFTAFFWVRRCFAVRTDSI